MMVWIYSIIFLIAALKVEDGNAALTIRVRQLRSGFQRPKLVVLIECGDLVYTRVTRTCLSKDVCGGRFNDEVQFVQGNTYCRRGGKTCQDFYSFHARFDHSLRVDLTQHSNDDPLTIEFSCIKAGQGLYVNGTYQASGKNSQSLNPGSIATPRGWHWQWYFDLGEYSYTWVTVAQCETLPTTVPSTMTTTTTPTTPATTSTPQHKTQLTTQLSGMAGANSSFETGTIGSMESNNNRIAVIVIPTVLVMLLLIAAALIIVIIFLRRRKQKPITALLNKFTRRNHKPVRTVPDPEQVADRHTYASVGDNNTYNRLGERIIVDRSPYYATHLDYADGVSRQPDATNDDNDTVSYHCVYDLQEQKTSHTSASNDNAEGRLRINGDVNTKVIKTKPDGLYENFPRNHEVEHTEELENVTLYSNDLYESSDVS